jgi:hypothetical protein
VSDARYGGYEISVTSMGAALAAKVRPKPMRKRAPMNMPTDCDAVCRTQAMIMMTAPIQTVRLRPMPSERYGAKG